MDETATLHFDLSHLAPDQQFTLHAGRIQYDLTPHTRRTLARSRRENGALSLIPDDHITHFTGPVRLPGNSPMLLRVTAPKRDPADPLDRLVLVSLHLPRRHRIAALARQRQRRPGQPLPVPPKLTALGVTSFPPGFDPDKIIIDVHDMTTAEDAAATLVFHHAELMTMQDKAADIFGICQSADGIDYLATSILQQSRAHETNPSNPNWVTSLPGKAWTKGAPLPPKGIYQWSGETVKWLGPPLRDALQTSKDAPELEKYCWTVQPGVTQVGAKLAPAAGLSAGSAASYTVKEITPQSGVEHQFSYDPGANQGTVGLKNYYLRWLQVSVDQFGPGGEQLGEMALLGQQSPVETIMAVPLAPDWSDYTFTFAPKANRAKVSFGGIGQPPNDAPRDIGGITWTAIFNFAIPTLFIYAGVAADQEGKAWSDLTKDVVSKVSGVTEAALEGPVGDAVTSSDPFPDILLAIANLAASMLLGILTEAGAEALSAFILLKLGESAAEDAAPFIGWIALAIGAAADLASITETSVEVARSPATMSISIERSLDVAVTIGPDSTRHGAWPSTATQYIITITYDDGPVYTYEGQLSAGTQGDISHTFTGLPWGGKITVLACFYASTGWLAAKGASLPVEVQPGPDGRLVVERFEIKENLVPLTGATTYTFQSKLVFAGGARSWAQAPDATAPTATHSNLNGANDGSNLGRLGQLAVNEEETTIGYSWQASGQHLPLVNTNQSQEWKGQDFTFQTIREQGDPQDPLKFCPAGYILPPCLAFPPPTMAQPPADGVLLEPDPASKTDDMLLRKLSLQPGDPLIVSPGQSFGRFTGPQDDLALHPAGYAVALNQDTCKLQILKFGELADDTATPAAAILAGQGSRPGLLYQPVALACSLDKIMVLQVTSDNPQGSICSFDVKGNPVFKFAGDAWQVGLHPEAGTVQLVDLSVEAKGYLYVLKYLTSASGSGTVLASDYRLDIYNPDGSFLTQVAGLAGARLHVDLWRDLYSLSYEILAGSGRTEPSVAKWIPSTPNVHVPGQESS
jgi:hypothetical protein